MSQVQETEQETEQVQLTGRMLELETKGKMLTVETARMAAEKLIDKARDSEFELGSILYAIRAYKLYTEDSFKDFVSGLLGNIGERKATYLINIFEVLMTLQIPAEDIMTLGWTKVRVLTAKPAGGSPILTSENWMDWVTNAEPMTVQELEDAVKAARPQKKGAVPISTATHLFKFKAHDDQVELINAAMAKKGKEIKSKVPGQILEAMALEIMNPAEPVTVVSEEQLSVVDLISAADAESWEEGEGFIREVVTALDNRFNDMEITVKIDPKESAPEG